MFLCGFVFGMMHKNQNKPTYEIENGENVSKCDRYQPYEIPCDN